MRYLLDVNALIDYGFRRRCFHDRVDIWMRSREGDHFLSSSITELGFVRVLGNVRTNGMYVERGRVLLLALKTNRVMRFDFLADANDLNSLRLWVKTPLQVTDGHLLQLPSPRKAIRFAVASFSIPSQLIKSFS
jgi:predicted nucleic acid-binding protein